MYSQDVTFCGGARVVYLTAVVRTLSTGVYAVAWYSTDERIGTGDGLFVEAAEASARWCAVADVVIQSGPAVILSGYEVISASARSRGEWYVCDGANSTSLVAEPCDLLPRLAGVYGWVVSGHQLASWPFGITRRSARSDGLA